jgi:hypothetical protein
MKLSINYITQNLLVGGERGNKAPTSKRYFLRNFKMEGNLYESVS